MKLLLRSIGVLSAIGGISMLIYVLLPIAKYQIISKAKFYTYLSPVPVNNESGVLAASGEGSDVDYTKATNWFEGGEGKGPAVWDTNVSYYTISIPRLKISNAIVTLGGEDLKESLIQYPGTALPGHAGNGVIFGHSILPQFYNPKNYLSIFSLLPTLKKGDTILVRFDGIEYKYIVEKLFEVRPQDVYILEQHDTDPYLSLVTCTPPGHPLRPKRLVVRAKIVPHDTVISSNF